MRLLSPIEDAENAASFAWNSLIFLGVVSGIGFGLYVYCPILYHNWVTPYCLLSSDHQAFRRMFHDVCVGGFILTYLTHIALIFLIPLFFTCISCVISIFLYNGIVDYIWKELLDN